jgi:hypothetical protein
MRFMVCSIVDRTACAVHSMPRLAAAGDITRQARNFWLPDTKWDLTSDATSALARQRQIGLSVRHDMLDTI